MGWRNFLSVLGLFVAVSIWVLPCPSATAQTTRDAHDPDPTADWKFGPEKAGILRTALRQRKNVQAAGMTAAFDLPPTRQLIGPLRACVVCEKWDFPAGGRELTINVIDGLAEIGMANPTVMRTITMDVYTKDAEQFVFEYQRDDDVEMICMPAGNGVRVEVREKGAEAKVYSFEKLPAPYGDPSQGAKTVKFKAGQIFKVCTFDMKKRELVPSSLQIVEVSERPNEQRTAKVVMKVGDRTATGVMDERWNMLEFTVEGIEFKSCEPELARKERARILRQ